MMVPGGDGGGDLPVLGGGVGVVGGGVVYLQLVMVEVTWRWLEVVVLVVGLVVMVVVIGVSGVGGVQLSTCKGKYLSNILVQSQGAQVQNELVGSLCNGCCLVIVAVL